MLNTAAATVVTADMLSGVAAEVGGAIPVIATVGIPVMIALMAFRLVPKVLKMFAK